MRFNGVNHIAMATGDMDTTIRFWRDLLGMRLIAGLGQPGYRHYFFEISDTCAIAFFEWPSVQPAEEKEHGRVVSGPFVFDHISFGMEADDELWMLKDRIDAAGFWVSEVIDHGFIHSIYSFDPNGIPVEFSCNVQEFDVRKNPVMADPEPSKTACEGEAPNADIWPKVQNPTPLQERRVYPGEGSRYFKRMKR
ncbi:MAG TPA: VOC family protein [Thermodesulfovibrionales bacterium]|nr:VOC family protein [Thermodesulfovibrionales bacterium]